jgi:hypothetical protein
MISTPVVHSLKPCTYLAPRLTLSLNRLKQASTWHTLHRSTIGCVQSAFHARGTFHANRAPFFCGNYNYLQKDWNKLPLDPCHLAVQSGASKMISEPMIHLAQAVHVSCIEIKISPNGPRQVSTWHTSGRSYIRCAQNDFWTNGTFGANRAPILHWG